VPSVWYENSPNVILEAFAHRTPVIASDLGGMAELVQHDVNGLVFEPGNAKALARQLRRLLDDSDLLARLRDGITPVRTIGDEMRQVIDIYGSVVRTDSCLSEREG
jgi:glycosyltransferase involved in cell wall biosynthesis